MTMNIKKISLYTLWTGVVLQLATAMIAIVAKKGHKERLSFSRPRPNRSCKCADSDSSESRSSPGYPRGNLS